MTTPDQAAAGQPAASNETPAPVLGEHAAAAQQNQADQQAVQDQAPQVPAQHVNPAQDAVDAQQAQSASSAGDGTVPAASATDGGSATVNQPPSGPSWTTDPSGVPQAADGSGTQPVATDTGANTAPGADQFMATSATNESPRMVPGPVTAGAHAHARLTQALAQADGTTPEGEDDTEPMDDAQAAGHFRSVIQAVIADLERWISASHRSAAQSEVR